MSKERIAKDIQEAQKRLDEELGKNAEDEPKLFSYPYGEYTLKIASLVEDLGYVGVSQTSGPIGMQSDLKELTRYAMSEVYADPKGFVTKLNTLPMPIDSVYPKEHLVYQQNPPILQIKLVKELKDMACYSSVGERLKLEWISKNELKVYSKKILKPPRDRYTCTAKAKNDRYYWYSHLWIIQD